MGTWLVILLFSQWFWGHFVFLFTKDQVKLKELAEQNSYEFLSCAAWGGHGRWYCQCINPDSDTRHILINPFVIYLITGDFLAFLNVEDVNAHT